MVASMHSKTIQYLWIWNEQGASTSIVWPSGAPGWTWVCLEISELLEPHPAELKVLRRWKQHFRSPLLWSKSAFYECGWGDGLTRKKKKTHPSAASMMSFLTPSALAAQLPARLQAVAAFPWGFCNFHRLCVAGFILVDQRLSADAESVRCVLCQVCLHCCRSAPILLATPATIADGRLIWSCLHLRCMRLKQIRMLKMLCWLTVLCKITAAQLCSSLRWIVRTCHAWSFQWDQWAFYPLKCSFRGQFSAGKWYCQARIVHLSVLIVFPVMFI